MQLPGKVEEEALGTMEGPAAGLLDASNGGFDQNIWSGSARADIEFLLPSTPVDATDSAVRSLSKRLILTKADAPPGTIARPIIAIRVRRLLDAGLADEAASLAMQADVHDNAEYARLRADAILMAGRTSDACGPATAARQTESSQFWLQLRAFCAGVSGDSATAEITRNVLDAESLGDPAFNLLLDDVMTKAKRSPGAIAKPTALHFFLLRRAGLPIPSDVARNLGPAADVVLLREGHATPSARLAAAERAVKAGAASIADLKAALDAQAFPPDRVAKAASLAPKLSFIAGQALLRRAAQLEPRAPMKAALIHQALLEADKAGMFEAAARLQADVAETIDAAAVTQGDAPLIGWALLMAGKPDAAAKFLGASDAARAVAALVSGKGDSALAAVATEFSADPKAPDKVRAFEALLLGVADVLGAPMPPEAKAAAKSAEATHWPGRRLDPQQLEVIVAASSTPGRRGEAILRILEAVGRAGPGDLAPDVTVGFLRALADMGIKDSARALGLHALLLYRPGTP
ncbi:MAG: hypothetical protein JO261_14870 [Alphaproteobacteria bacterium]|nr:hypothetical protein [Alphaproteobacteria bacterium]MBV9694978.1 hypothetical protein [Alphaproteobacteria bacterium]